MEFERRDFLRLAAGAMMLPNASRSVSPSLLPKNPTPLALTQAIDSYRSKVNGAKAVFMGWQYDMAEKETVVEMVRDARQEGEVLMQVLRQHYPSASKTRPRFIQHKDFPARGVRYQGENPFGIGEIECLEESIRIGEENAKTTVQQIRAITEHNHLDYWTRRSVFERPEFPKPNTWPN